MLYILDNIFPSQITHHQCGIETALPASCGTMLTTGDEVSYNGINGRRGFVALIEGRIWYITNKERSEIHPDAKKILKKYKSAFCDFDLPCTDSRRLVLLNRCADYKHGNVIATGRQGHRGFQVVEK